MNTRVYRAAFLAAALATGLAACASSHPAASTKPGPPLVTAQTAEQSWRKGAAAWLLVHPAPPRKGMTDGIVASADASGNLDSVTWTLSIVTASGLTVPVTCVNGQVNRDCPWLSGPDVLAGAASVDPVGYWVYFRSTGDIDGPHDTRVIQREW